MEKCRARRAPLRAPISGKSKIHAPRSSRSFSFADLGWLTARSTQELQETARTGSISLCDVERAEPVLGIGFCFPALARGGRERGGEVTER